MAEPIMDQYAKVSAYDVHSYQVRCTFAAGTAMTYRSRDTVPVRGAATTVTVTFPKTYTEIVGFKANRFAATGAAFLEWIITSITTDSNGGITGVVVTSINNAGSATTPASGDIAYFDFALSCDVLNDRFTGSNA